MTEILNLIKYDFDSMENNACAARTKEVVGVFVAQGDLTARGVAAKWLEKHAPVELYLGWDMEIYPKYKLEYVKQLGGE